MAQRSTRRLLIDKAEASVRELDQVVSKLSQISAIYYEAGIHHGATLDLIIESVTTIRDSISRFRNERM
tara:strand:+ start:804 stop:1010 length:207 start_codon:yes stop_codon:yes gene_type:complete